MGRIVRKPVILGSATAIILAVTLRAYRLRGAEERVVIPWLDELEKSFSDTAVAQLKREHATPKPGQHQGIQISPVARRLLDNPLVQEGKSLRICVINSERRSTPRNKPALGQKG